MNLKSRHARMEIVRFFMDLFISEMLKINKFAVFYSQRITFKKSSWNFEIEVLPRPYVNYAIFMDLLIIKMLKINIFRVFKSNRTHFRKIKVEFCSIFEL